VVCAGRRPLGREGHDSTESVNPSGPYLTSNMGRLK